MGNLKTVEIRKKTVKLKTTTNKIIERLVIKAANLTYELHEEGKLPERDEAVIKILGMFCEELYRLHAYAKVNMSAHPELEFEYFSVLIFLA